VHELRTHADALALRRALRDGAARLAVLGAGLIGMEVAASAAALGCKVTLIEAAATPLERALPASLGHWLVTLHRRHGIEVRLSTTVTHASLRARSARLQLSDATTLECDAILVAAGITPATGWLAGAGLSCGAIPTDTAGRTALPGVYDAASYPDPYAGGRRPSQHWEAAARQGAAVARAILGHAPSAPVPPAFWTDQHGHRIQIVGHAPLGAQLELEGDPTSGEPFIVWMTDRGRPAAVLLADARSAAQSTPAIRAEPSWDPRHIGRTTAQHTPGFDCRGPSIGTKEQGTLFSQNAAVA